MAIYHLTTKIVQRSKGHSAVAAAAYRARMEITNERTGETWNYARRVGDVLFSGIYLPKDAPEWMRDRAKLWNSVEKAELRGDAQVARDFVVALPHELDLDQQRKATQDWVRENFTRKGLVADVSIHRPGGEGDERNVHAHVMVTMRQVDGAQFATRKERTQDRKADLETWRDSWEKIGNRHLERAGHLPTLDRRSLEAQDIDRVPTIHMGKDAAELERKGIQTDRGDINRTADAINLERQLRQKYGHEVTVSELQPRSAVERMRDEDQAERVNELKQNRAVPASTSELYAAINALSRTSSTATGRVVLGVNRAELMQGRAIDLNAEKKQSAIQQADQKERDAFAAELRGETVAAAAEARAMPPVQPATVPEQLPRKSIWQGLVSRLFSRSQPVAVAPIQDGPRPADRAENAAKRYLLKRALDAEEVIRKRREQERKQQAAADVFTKYNQPPPTQEQQAQQRAEAWSKDRPDRHTMGRVGGLLDALNMTPDEQRARDRETAQRVAEKVKKLRQENKLDHERGQSRDLDLEL